MSGLSKSQVSLLDEEIDIRVGPAFGDPCPKAAMDPGAE
jgi:hypothetical protein